MPDPKITPLSAKPTMLQTTHVARRLGIGQRRVEQLCQEGKIRNWIRPGGRLGHYMIPSNEIDHLLNPEPD